MKKYLVILFMLLTCAVNAQVVNTSVWFAPPASETGVDSASWESEYKDVYYAIAESGRPALDTADLQNDMVRSLKDSLLTFDRIYLFYVFAQKTAAGALINWDDPGTFDLTDPSSTEPTFTQYSNYEGDGSSDYFKTGLIPATHLPESALNSISIAYYELDDDYNTEKCPIGVEEQSAILKIRPMSGGGLRGYLNAGGAVIGVVDNASGLSIVTRRGAADTEAYKDGLTVGTGTYGSYRLPSTYDLAVLAVNDDGVIDEFSVGKAALIMLLDKLSDEEARALNTIIETYMDAIGVGVQ